MTTAAFVLTLLMPTAPLLACVVTLVRGGRLPALVGSLTVFGAAVAAVLLIAGGWWPTGRTWELYRWLDAPPGIPLDVTVSLRIDALSATLLSMAAAVTLLTIQSAGRRGGPDAVRLWAGASFLLFATAMLLLAANFLVLFVFWQIAALAGWLLSGSFPPVGWTSKSVREEEQNVSPVRWTSKSVRQEQSVSRTDLEVHPTNSAATLKWFLVHRAADVVLAYGLFVMWTLFGSFDFAVVLEGADGPSRLAELLADDQPDDVFARHRGEVAVICLCLTAAVIGRSGLFPLFGWLDDAARAPAAVNALVLAGTVVPTGVYLIARALPLFAAVPEARLLLALVGGLTALLGSAAAAAATHLTQVLARCTAGWMGIIVLGFASGERSGAVAGLFLLLTHGLVQGALFLAARSFAGGTFLLGSLVLASGFWGQNAALSAVWDADGPQAVAFWLATLSMFFTSFALFRAYFLTFHRERPVLAKAADGPLLPSSAIGRGPLLLIVAAVVAGPVVGGPLGLFNLLLGESVPGEPAAASLFLLGFGLPLVLLGAVCAWMAYAPVENRGQAPVVLEKRGKSHSREDACPLVSTGDSAPAATDEGSFVRLGRRWFYLDEFLHFALVLPVRGAAWFVHVCDRRLIDGPLNTGLPRLVRLSAKTAGALQTGVTSFSALSLMLTTAVLLAVLLWMRR